MLVPLLSRLCKLYQPYMSNLQFYSPNHVFDLHAKPSAEKFLVGGKAVN